MESFPGSDSSSGSGPREGPPQPAVTSSPAGGDTIPCTLRPVGLACAPQVGSDLPAALLDCRAASTPHDPAKPGGHQWACSDLAQKGRIATLTVMSCPSGHCFSSHLVQPPSLNCPLVGLVPPAFENIPFTASERRASLLGWVSIWETAEGAGSQAGGMSGNLGDACKAASFMLLLWGPLVPLGLSSGFCGWCACTQQDSGRGLRKLWVAN